MIERDAEGRITLSWSQAIWSLSIIATIIGSYFGIQAKIDKMSYIVIDDTTRIEKLEGRVRDLDIARRDIDQLRDDIERLKHRGH